MREFRTGQEMRAHYRTVRDNLWHPPSPTIGAAMATPSLPKRKGPRVIVVERTSTAPTIEERGPVDHDPSQPPLKPTDIDAIMRVVAGFFRVPVTQMNSPDRRVGMILPRFVAIYLARVMTHASTTEIGRAFKRDHSTIANALNRVERRLERDEDFVNTVRLVRTRIVRYFEQQPRGST